MPPASVRMPRDAFGLVNTPVADDPTLRPGDIVATNAGLMAYNSGPNGSTFTPISTYAGLSADLRHQLTEIKIEPSAEGPSPPPVWQAEAPPDRSTTNKRAEADRKAANQSALHRVPLCCSGVSWADPERQLILLTATPSASCCSANPSYSAGAGIYADGYGTGREKWQSHIRPADAHALPQGRVYRSSEL